jgi:hypothetical protein
MSKMKLSFSLFFAIFLVGILSTAAFAHSAYNLGVKAIATGFTFSFDTTYQVATTTSKDYTLNVYSVDPATQALSTTPVATHDFTVAAGDTTKQSYDVITANTVGTLYDFVLTDKTTGTVLGEKFGVKTDASNLKLANVADAGGQITYTKPGRTLPVTLDIKGSGLANSNHTGADSAKKSGQKTHGFYQNNTNSCAVCHQTHTGSDGNLLMKNGVYSTCSACHDGTTGAYNAFEKTSAETAISMAGTFNVGSDAAHNGSIHEADGALKVSAAPGGNASPVAKTGFDSSFDCASCHNPHGGGSASENNLNQDPLSWGTVVYNGTVGTSLTNVFGKTVVTTKDNKYGKLYQSPTIYTVATIPTTNVAPYIFVKTTTDAVQANVDANPFYKRANVPANSPILQTYRWQKGGYVADYSLWLQEKGYPFKADTALYSEDWANLTLNAANNYNDSAKDVTRAADVTVVWRDGFAFGAGVTGVKSIQVSLGIDVETTPYVQTLYDEEFTKTDTDTKGVSTTYTYIKDSGVEISKYCASCHTDYLSATRNDITGVYTQAHRHMTLADETNCIRCHFGHGSDATIMSDSNDNNYYEGPKAGNLDYYTDVNKSSALKRYTGMAVCYACHGQGEQFLGNPNNVDHPVAGQPGTRGAYAE